MQLRFAFFLLGLVAFCVDVGTARAQSAYVATNGSDSNSCVTTATPCKSLAVALEAVAGGGTIFCLNSSSDVYPLFISKSVTIDCAANNFFLQNFPGNFGIQIAVNQSDGLSTVVLRGLVISSTNNASPGIKIVAAKNVIIENSKIQEQNAQGILDVRTAPSKLLIKDTTVNSNVGPGIVIAGPAGNAAVLDHVTSNGNSYGLAVAAGNSVTATHSNFSGNSVAGIVGDGGSQVVVDNSTVSNNATGVSGASSVRLYNNTISFNTTATSGATGSFGGNRFSGNGSAGTPLTPLGSASTDFGQQ
ncbi:right-handed parallel beta-helix repeat-containing protein [Bradyrhizobium genosp. L]|uniref:right-handed parallel beta-helix repeat-containing protein n=1 Tax=Bradyrhizobium genosp. L TaxID=83637 RepID=UPI0018A27B7C|nr:right-handed parallel beta-helix repeat-containing protein [Bradyrhizobium genosp. L]QPF86412.1 right-handed parallel beta-helix repeat-containing protein [Bradyrhizobium genosp. L]